MKYHLQTFTSSDNIGLASTTSYERNDYSAQILSSVHDKIFLSFFLFDVKFLHKASAATAKYVFVVLIIIK